jgi:lipopolysaccharide export system permease protein
VRCLTRYILLEFIKVFSVALAGITLLMVLGVVGQEFLRRGLSPLNLVRLIPFALPIAMLYAIPATTLFAACSVYGRMSAENELVAVKSLGITPMATIRPSLALAFLLSLLVVGLTDLAVTWGRHGINRVILESVEQIAYGMLRTQRSYSSHRFSINVKKVIGRTLIKPTLSFRSADNEPPLIFTAEEAELESNLEANALRITLRDWEMDGAASGVMMEWPGPKVFDIPLPDAANKPGSSGRPADIAMNRIAGEVKAQQMKIAWLEESSAAEAAYHLMTGGFPELVVSDWQERRAELSHARERLHRLYTEPWRRWANGFSCLAFVVVGAPLAIRMRNSDVWTSFAVCFLPILGIYYPLLAYGVDQAKSGALPAYCVWAGNACLGIIGAFLIRRAMRF